MRRPSPTSAKRWAIKVALCLLAGAAVTWGVAWGCALWRMIGPTMTFVSEESWQLRVDLSESPFEERWELSETRFADGGWVVRIVPSWVRRPSNGDFVTVSTAYGVPFRSMMETAAAQMQRGTFAAETITPPGWNWVSDGINLEYGPPRETLPLRFLPLGFALNTLFYAAVLLGAVEFVAFARRRVRRGRGRCPSCGYDRAGLAEGAACPECGGKA